MIEKAMKNKIRKHYVFTGRVQGVGFRYTAYHIATQLGITGWVYNEWDGSVIMEAQGDSSLLDKMVSLIDQGTFIHIEGIDEKEIPVLSHELSFEMKN